MQPSQFWSIGDYRVIGDLWSAPGRDVVGSLDVAGKDVIDLATGTGVSAIAAASRGAASVTGVDITPALLAEAGRRAEAAGVDIRWVEADVQSVPLPDASADLVISSVGLIFAEDPDQALAEARRLTRPGGQIVFTSWSPAGLFGKLRVVMMEYFPQEPEPWHESPDRIREIAGAQAVVEERTFELVVASPEDFVDQMERLSSPFVIARENLQPQWHRIHDKLVTAVAAQGRMVDGQFRARVPYWVCTVPIA